MSRVGRLAGCVLLTLTAIMTSGCNEGGIGMGVPSSGGGWARWGSGAPGPDVIVGGGPVYR